MTQAYEVQIADAIVSELNSTSRTWSQGFRAKRSWLPVYDADELVDLQVSVVPLTIEEEDETRTLDRYRYGVAIDLQKSVKIDRRDEIDQLTKLAEEIHDFFANDHALETLTDYRVIDAVRSDVYDLERLLADHTWETLIVATVEGFR